MRFTVWHNNIGRPIALRFPFATEYYEGRAGTHPGSVGEWLRTLERFGHAITVPDSARRWSNHKIIGVGVGHSDVDWCESRFRQGSMAAYYENEAGEPWWEEGAWSRRYYERSAA